MKKRKSKYTFSIFKKELPLHLMLLPGVLMILVFNYTTMAGLIIAFQKFIPSKGCLVIRNGWGLITSGMYLSFLVFLRR